MSSPAAVVIDSFLDFDAGNCTVRTEWTDALLPHDRQEGDHVDKILKTHVHAVHLTATKYAQRKLAQMQRPNSRWH
jgi:glyoxylase-like metal-dependent hydrolase (beta-lactamase superfamily II)